MSSLTEISTTALRVVTLLWTRSRDPPPGRAPALHSPTPFPAKLRSPRYALVPSDYRYRRTTSALADLGGLIMNYKTKSRGCLNVIICYSRHGYAI